MKKYTFDQVVEDCTSKFHKIKKEDYLSEGLYKIVDQGKQFIAGYINDKNLVNTNISPIIIFGDHTKVFKYVDFPLALGADGTKVLTIKNNLADCKYLYYYFKTLKLPDAGYSRHFKFLKEISIPLPENFDDQTRIADVLTRVDSLIAKRRKSIEGLEEFLKSTFEEMFGEKLRKEWKWKETKLGNISETQGGLQVSAKRVHNPIELPYLRVANVYRDLLDLREIKTIKVTEEEAKRVRLKKGDVLIVEGHGNPREIGRSAVWNDSIDNCLHQNHLIRVRVDTQYALPVFISHYINSASGRRQMFKAGKTTSGLNTINSKNVKETLISLPPLSLQNKFATIVDKVEVLKKKYTQSLTNLLNLYSSLSQRAFKGELNLSKIALETKNELSEFYKGEKGMQSSNGELNESVEYSEAILLEFIQSKLEETFSFDSLMSELEKTPFNEMPKYEEIKKQIYKLLKDLKLTQTLEETINDFGKIEKKLMLRVSL